MASEHLKMMQAMRGLCGGDIAILATVVRVSGSSYRALGARMLVMPDGQRIGSVSGGCIEGEIAKKGWWWTEGGTAYLRRYDTKLEDDGSGYGLACNGSIDVLVERVHPNDAASPLRLLDEIYGSRKRSAVATLFEEKLDGHANILGRAVLAENKPPLRMTRRLTAEQLDAVAPYLHSALFDQVSSRTALQLAGITCEALIEFVEAPLQLIVCGAGFDADPVVSFAADLGWQVTVCDGRTALARAQRFPQAQRVFALRSTDELASIQADDRTACIIMTHSYEQDRALLSHWLPRGLPYLGILGARSRTRDLLEEADVPFDASNIFAPAGLDIGSESPEEIALSIVAEIQACFRNRRGAPLRDRLGSIHAREIAREPVSRASRQRTRSAASF